MTSNWIYVIEVMNQILHSYFPKVNGTKLHFLQISLEVSRAFLFVLTKDQFAQVLYDTAGCSSFFKVAFYFQHPEISPHQYYIFWSN